MIKSIRLFNFQSHKSTELNFHKNVNVIVGNSNSGKSAIIRAISMVINNRPNGSGMISHWSKKGMSVSLQIEDGTIIKRARAQGFNGYKIIKGKSVNKLEAIKFSVPDQVSKLLNIGEVNIQSQMDAPFLISKSPADVARFLNEQINLNLIDSILRLVEKKRREINSTINEADFELVSIEKQLRAFDGLDAIEDKIKRIKEIKDRIDDHEEKYASLEKYMIRLKSVVTKGNKYRAIDFDNLLKKSTEFNQNIIAQKNKISLLKSLITRIVECVSGVKEIGDEILRLEKAMPKVCPLCGSKIK